MMFGDWGTKDHDESIKTIHRALDAGITFVDTADVYSQGESEVIVGMIRDRVSCDVYRTEAGEPYSGDYDETVGRNVREQDADARPAVAKPLPDITGYDVVLLGSGLWHVRPPMSGALPAAVGRGHEPFEDPFLAGLGDAGTGDLDGQWDVTVHDPQGCHFL